MIAPAHPNPPRIAVAEDDPSACAAALARLLSNRSTWDAMLARAKAQLKAATGPIAAGPVPQFAFESIAGLDDTALAKSLRGLLRATAAYGASDLHFSTGARPFVRKNRAFSFLSNYVLTSEDALRLNTVLLSEGQKKIYLDRKDYDYALALSGTDRYRVNLMFHKNGSAGSYRMVPEKVRSLKDLGFSQHVETLKKLLTYHNGLILITGPVGSGKTTTLASMVDYLNSSRTDHIITVEDPIEVVQPAKGCNVTQREVGPHTRTFASALKGALREDPDVIVIGELRDLETIEMAISASETGHLVIGTMHTSDAATTLNRLLDVFPPAQQTQIRSSVAESLRGIVCQRLLPATDGHLALVEAADRALAFPALAGLAGLLLDASDRFGVRTGDQQLAQAQHYTGQHRSQCKDDSCDSRRPRMQSPEGRARSDVRGAENSWTTD